LLFTRTGDAGTPDDNVITSDAGATLLFNTVNVIDSSGGGLTTIPVPATSVVGHWFELLEGGGAVAAYPVLLTGATINGDATGLLITIPNSRMRFTWRGGSIGYGVALS
jgi:hypothetical protein